MCHNSNEEFNIEYNLNSIKIYVNITMCKIVRFQKKKKNYEVKQKLNNINLIYIYYKLFRTYLANFHPLVLELHTICLAS